jgi:DNA ligase D-like protein (predicted ligase)
MLKSPKNSRPAANRAGFIEPMKCLPVAALPEGSAWEYELKLDGYRAIGVKSAGRAHLFSRNHKDLAKRFPAVAHALERLPDETAVDGEIIAFDQDGRPSFDVLQNHVGSAPPLRFYLFDMPMLAGRDLTRRPLGERRAMLRERVIPLMPETVRLSEPIDASAAEVLGAVRKAGLEGLVAKRCDSLYEAGKRSGAWVKLRINRRQDLVIGGYTPAGRGFDALLVGYYDGPRLLYAASLRNGLTLATRAAVFKRFGGLRVARCPFANLPEAHKGRWGEGLTADDMKRCRWLKPQLVAAIEFLEWTSANHLRHAKFLALRDDVKPREVVRERPDADRH